MWRLIIKLLEQLPGECHIYNSIDTVLSIDDAVKYPVEFLNSLTPPGLPLHNNHLRIGEPVMLLRNLDPPKLCNDTRLIIKKMMLTVLETTILTGKASGKNSTYSLGYAFQYKCLQFPLKLSFEMDINKVQGQSLDVVGLDLA
ncbi:uncharacterized protein LOC106875348 [Octopus bimaculoides]|uniref:uncharacterized protein LOC106875348 n=1 Tax=Octopus bimaculoides TaxID=37653 RepID=UPI00071C9840|nr:uncharacterized protein LOC106875348 [Octopus bimaculoides]|eukprot:XP_014778924.1 PREDICTED: uncharacterized protein LOC106875348 [Octopus bimaculoides]